MSGHTAQLRRRPKPRRFFTTVTIIAVTLLCMGMYGCGGGGSDSSSSSDDIVSSTNFKEVFTDGMRELTPNVQTSAVTDWDGWCADGEAEHQYSVLTKLFNPDSGWESVFGPVEEVENVLEILETYAEELATNGEHTIEPGDGLTYTATVSDFSGDFTVPYFEDTQTGLTKQVVITASDDSWSMMVAYDMDGDDKAMVVHTNRPDGDEGTTSYMVFRATFNETSQVLQIWVAAANDDTDSFKISFVWKGDVAAGTFALTQYTNAAKDDVDDDGIFETDGFWKVMGGGNMDSQMAFRANTADSEEDDYFVVVTMDDILSSEVPAEYPADSGTIDSEASEVQGYIDETNDNCLGFLTGFPEVADLDDWDY